jgi:hypothetical protein
VVPEYEIIQGYIEAFKKLHPLLRFRLTQEAISKTTAVFKNMDASVKWAEIKSRWPESREGPISSAHVSLELYVSVNYPYHSS